jgi:hypothetical protein
MPPDSTETLRRRLLSYGGTAVISRYDPDVPAILERGRLFRSWRIRMRPGRPSGCHANIAWLYKEDPTIQVCTGYALTVDDGLWRQHSWGFDGRHVLETTVRRSLYFGMVLTPEEAEVFAAENP